MAKKPKPDAPSTPPDLESDAIPEPESGAPPAETEPADQPALATPAEVATLAADLDEWEKHKAEVAELRKQVLVLGKCMSAIVRDPSEMSMDQGLANKIRNALAIANF